MSLNLKKSINHFLYRVKQGENIFTHTTFEERVFLKKMVKASDGNALEIGSYLGASTCYIADALKQSRRKVYCVDTWQNDAMSEGKKETLDQFISNTKDYKENIVICRGFSKEVSFTIKEKFGFVFFDGDHSYEGIKTDWDSWKGKLAVNPVLCFHDYGWAEGVQKLIHDEIKPLAKEDGHLPNMYWVKL
jgi:hypothetical protein